MLPSKEKFGIALILLVLIAAFYAIGIRQGYSQASEEFANQNPVLGPSSENKSLGIISGINPGVKPTVKAVLGFETVESPSYLLIWILAVAVISGLIIEVTKLKPGWFRVFMASTYTTLPLVVNFYTKNIWFAFSVIALQTIILTILYFTQWKEHALKIIASKKA